MSARVLVLFNDDGALAGGSASDRVAVEAVVGMAASIRTALLARGFAAEIAPCPRAPERIAALLARQAPELVFHCVESLDGEPRFEAALAWLLELAGIAYTGAPAAAIGLGLDKPLCKALLRSRGVPTPDWLVLERADEPLELARAGAPPWIVKPAREDASHGITRASIVRDEAALRARAAELIASYRQPALVEQYIEGRELNVAILGEGPQARALPLAEIDFSSLPADHPRILTYEAKWDEQSPVYTGSPSIAALLDEATAERVRAVALAAYRAAGMRDFGRVDLRLCPRRGPLVLEINPNPDLSPEAGFAKAARRGGLAYEDLIEGIARLALERAHARAAQPAEVARPPARLRGLLPSDRPALERILRATEAFAEHEIAVALELVDAGLGAQAEDPYLFAIAEDARGELAGYACWGHRPGSAGEYDLYWIAVDPALHGAGIGRQLVQAVEQAVRAAGGSSVIVETASKPSYAATRAFYERCGYRVQRREPDHYAPGDDLLVYVRALD